MSASQKPSYCFYDGTLQRVGSRFGTEAFLDNEWIGIVPSEEEWNRRRSISSTEAERIVAEYVDLARPVTYYLKGSELIKLFGSWEPGYGRPVTYCGGGAWFVDHTVDGRTSEGCAELTEITGEEAAKRMAEIDERLERQQGA